MQRFIITGAPGTGKTALLLSLASDFDTVAEPAREVIAEHRVATGEKTLDGRPDLFVELLVQRSIEKFQSVGDRAPALFDRGLPDCAAYAIAGGIDPEPALSQARRFRYDEPVFIAPPWADIYTTDELRRATFEQVEAFHSSLLWTYRQLGYELVELPRTSVDRRAVLIADQLRSR